MSLSEHGSMEMLTFYY